jgi:mannose-6-phosphate isomerase-like protein (cupin superfamily)
MDPPQEPCPLVLHHNARVAIELMGGVRWERLTPADENGIQFLEIQYQPGASSGQAMSRHTGREFGLVLEGHLRVDVGAESFSLHVGDSIIFDSNLPHRLMNEGNELVRAIWIDMKQTN